MRNLFNSLTILLALITATSSQINAQEPVSQGFVNVVNLIPSDKPCTISITGKDVVPGGLASADSTGWFIVPAGNLQFSLEVKGYEKATGAVDLSAMQTSAFVIFLESSGKTDSEGKPFPPKIKLKRCEAIEGKSGFFLKVVSLCPDENTFLLGSNPMTLKLYQEAEVPNWNGGGFKISRDQAVIGEARPQLEKDPFYLFVGTDHAGKYCTTLIRASKVDLPPWMKEKKPKP